MSGSNSAADCTPRDATPPLQEVMNRCELPVNPPGFGCQVPGNPEIHMLTVVKELEE